MAYFISYRHTDADPQQLQQLLPAIRDAFTAAGETIYSTYFEDESFRAAHSTPAEMMRHAFTKIDELRGLFVIQNSNERSEGMLMEVGYCLAKNYPICVATQQNVQHTYLPSMVKRHLVYNDIEDLIQQVRSGACT